ncbi:MAG: DUF448 domain-containing protein [Magnetococcales bacterium]|nr:DUF448 domain-containing protein [Magnetococcales bacterium]
MGSGRVNTAPGKGSTPGKGSAPGGGKAGRGGRGRGASARARRGAEVATTAEATDPSAVKVVETPLRQCVLCRESRSPGELLRFTVSPEGQLVEDLGERLGGRGFYLHPSADEVRQMLRRSGQMGRWSGFEGRVALPEAELLTQRLAAALTRRLYDGLGLARRAGLLHLGFEIVKERLERGEPLVVLMATDTAHHTREKVERLMRKQGPGDLLEAGFRDALGAACGVGPVAVLGLVPGRQASRLRLDVMRWRAFTGPFESGGTGSDGGTGGSSGEGG